jgi:uncharacterized protein
MSENKKTIQLYMDGFNETNHEKVLSCLTENIIWDMAGFFHLEGKKEVDQNIENDAFEGSPNIKILRMVEENNFVVAEGSVHVKRTAGGYLDALFCDIFQMENSKIRHISTYQMDLPVQSRF